MTLINKIGFLGLIGVVILIVIYLIRPNYQQKTISSTYVWKLSLKKRKKRIPVSKLRNLLLFLSQMLALTCLAAILIKPAIVLKEPTQETEAIFILDASASMRTESEETGDTRFERAVGLLREQVSKIVTSGGKASVILAGKSPEYLCRRITLAEYNTTVESIFNELENTECDYVVADIDAALKESEEVLYVNPDASVYVITDANYEYVPQSVHVLNVAQEGEWNAGILDAFAFWDAGYYAFNVKVACYGMDARIPLEITIYNANYSSDFKGETWKCNVMAECSDGEPLELLMRYRRDSETFPESTKNQQVLDLSNILSGKLYSFSSVSLSLDVEDCYYEDDRFEVYGGKKESLKVQYASTDPNPFVSSALSNLQSDFAAAWNMSVTEIRKDEMGATEGYDLYIYEHVMPDELPTDGVVFLFDPIVAPIDSGFRVSGTELAVASKVGGNWPTLYNDVDHPLMKNVDPNYISVSAYRPVTSVDASYTTLMSLNKLPMLMVRNDMEKPNGRQVMVISFPFAYSNLGILPEFYTLMRNAFNYFFPSTVQKYAFEVGETLELNARSSSLSVSFAEWEEPVVKDTFPAQLVLNTPGTYTISQTNYYNRSISENIYVKMPSEESDITGVRATLYTPLCEKREEDYFKDVITAIAAALVVFLFIEWCLHLRDGV